MSQVVFVLGAGASQAAGAPLMADFLDRAKKLLSQGLETEADARFREVFDGITALQTVHSKSQLDIFNVESVFATFEMAAVLRKFPGMEPDKTAALVESLKFLIATTIEETLLIPWRDGAPRPPDPYGDFTDLIRYLRTEAMPRRTVSIITFNYDLACDYALYSGRIPVDYALGETVDGAAVRLLKLHGSLNWAYCPVMEKVVPWALPEYCNKYRWRPYETSATLKLDVTRRLPEFKYQDNDVDPKPVLIPPTWNKAEHHKNLTDVWSQAAKDLTDAEDIFIVGYSLPDTDAFFKYLYALGTEGGTPLARLWVFNPDAAVEDRFRALVGPGAVSRFHFFRNTFAEALPRIRREYPGLR